MISTVLFDLDGVIRHFDHEVGARIERRLGIAPGEIPRIAFSGTRLQRLTTGRLSRVDWIAGIGEELGDRAAAEEWGGQPSLLDEEVLSLVEELVACGIRAAILTNGSDATAEETAALGLDSRFDPIFNTADIGVAKPDARAFTHVLDALGAEPGSVLFTDDTPANVTAAQALGIRAHRFRDARSLRMALREHGVALGA
ncbi:HAD family phosphatase [Microbacterium soli]|uniref:Haloacid dehalogenase n=1 Tax=Microbacterium soli TaxID=446075 RepID=A0ABP7MR68_9MICO